MTATLKSAWQTFSAALENRQRKLVSEMTSAWDDTFALLGVVRGAFIAQ